MRRVAVVSGVARPPGIGRATALRLAAGGAHVVCAEVIDDAPADTGAAPRWLFDRVVAEVAAAGPGEALAVPQDAFDPDGVVRAAVDRFGRLDVCCALAGATGPGAGDGPLLEVTDAGWQRCLDANLGGTFRLLRSAAAAMVRAGTPGVLVALSSHAAQAPAAGTGAVGAARLAVQHLVAVLAAELGRHGIRCAAVAPLAVAPAEPFGNPGLVALAERTAGSLDAWLAGTSPLGRGQRADETAAVIEFLCSDAASYLSGITVPVTGGAR